MGLDQYLSVRRYVTRMNYTENTKTQDEKFNAVIDALNINSNLVDPNGYVGLEVSVPVAYWRKDNQIHNWFVQTLADGVDECQPIYLNKKKLEDLRNTCNVVLSFQGTSSGKEVAEKLLPTQSGFFFGGTEYDEWYYGALQNTVDRLTEILNSTDEHEDVIYQASW